ncbi:hypothetical protein A4A49_61790, partial [Nicotiana attenuata]
MGYSAVQKCYLLFDLTHKKFFVCRNVTFRETVFPFKDLKIKGTAMFPLDPSLITQDVTTANTTDSAPTTAIDPQLEDHSEEQGVGMEDLYSEEATTSEPGDIGPTVADEGAGTLEDASVHQDIMSAEDNHEAPLRKSTRDKGPPLWMNDYVTAQASRSCHYPMSNYLDYNSMSHIYQANLAAFSTTVEPTSFDEACEDPKWLDAM